MLSESEMEAILCGTEDCRMGRVYEFLGDKGWNRFILQEAKRNHYFITREEEEMTKKMVMHFHKHLAPCCVKGLCIFGD